MTCAVFSLVGLPGGPGGPGGRRQIDEALGGACKI